MRTWISDLPRPAKITALCAVLGWILTLSFSSSATNNGVVTSCSYYDIGALALGVIGIITAVDSGRFSRTERAKKIGTATPALVIGGVGLLFGLIHVVRGIGLVGGPCN